MILRKAMSLLGIGSALIDLILEGNVFRAGDKIKGHFALKGGTIEQKIIRIDCDLVMIDKKTGLENVIGSNTILSSTVIHAGEQNELGFSFTLPEALENSSSTITYIFKTKLTFNEGVESKDQDYIRIIS